MRETYLYPYSAEEACRRGEQSLWRASYLENIDCKDAIQKAVRQHYDGDHLDKKCLTEVIQEFGYHGPVTTDRYGRKIPKHAVGTENFHYTSSASDLLRAVTALYDRIVNPNLLIRRLSISANKLLPEADSPKDEAEQLDLFTDYAAKERREQADEAAHARERKIQEAMLGIKKKYGKNAILKGMNLEEGATARERNETIGGHHA